VLLLSFQLGERVYAMACSHILEIVPRIEVDPVPGGPPYLMGQFDYRGQVVPVIDLRRLVAGEPCQASLSTRIIVVEQTAAGAGLRAIGLLAERVTETFHKDVAEFSGVGVEVEELRFLAGIFVSERGMVHLLDVPGLCDALRTRSLTSPVLHELLLDRGWS
jgi:chemotaxis-related protein WspB